MISIRLPEVIEKRLKLLARRTGRTMSHYAREAILGRLGEMEAAGRAERQGLKVLKSGG
jgi:predicted DNA-binding protein